MATMAVLTSPAAEANATATSRRQASQAFARSLVVAVAFLLGLMTARNSDVWAHLASGRAVVFSVGNVRPDSWLADLAMYLIYSAFGGAGLVVAKAGLIAATAAVLLGPVRSRRGVLVGFLAVLALGGWMPLNPVCAGYLFLALTVTQLNRNDSEAERGWGQVLRSHKWLLLGYTIWANASTWCVLGVVFVGLHALVKTLIQIIRGDGVDRGVWRLFALVFIASSLSPFLLDAGRSLPELGSLLRNPENVLSPFRLTTLAPLGHGRVEGEVPLLAFWLLIGVVVSSALVALRVETGEARMLVWTRFILWLVLLAAAAFNARLVPFLVVAGGATAVLNLRYFGIIRNTTVSVLRHSRDGCATDLAPSAPAVRPRSPVERLRMGVQFGLSLLVATVLLSAAWTGWLQSFPAERRNWSVEADPSLLRAAEEVKGWFESGRVNNRRQTVFLSAEAEEAFRWFAPHSPTANPPASRVSVAQVRTAVLQLKQSAASPGQPDVLSDPQVGCVVVCDPNRAVFAAALRTLSNSDQWKLAYLCGRVAIFVRADSKLPALDLQARAFSASADRAPAGDGSPFAVQGHWYDPFVLARPPRSIDRDEAVTYLLHEEATRDRRRALGARHFLATMVASVVAGPAPALVRLPFDARIVVLSDALKSVAPVNGVATPFPYDQFAAFQILANGLGDNYLAVRAARRAVAASPRDASAFEALGEAYLQLLVDPLEGTWSRGFPVLRQLRLCQAAAAFRQATVLDPSRPTAHARLAAVYLENRFDDLALEELRAAERLTPGPLPADAAERIRTLGEAVGNARQSTAANAANLDLVDRARLAERNGLAGGALDMLLQSHAASFGNAGIAQELTLLIAAGRAADARAWTAPEHREAEGALTYDWLMIQAAAAVGDYAGAADILRNQIATLPTTRALLSAKDFWAAAALAGKEVLFKRQNEARMAVALSASLLSQFASGCRQLLFERQTRTEAYLLLTLFALESGDVAAGQGYLESVRQLWEDVDKSGISIPSSQRIVLQQMGGLIRVRE